MVLGCTTAQSVGPLPNAPRRATDAGSSRNSQKRHQMIEEELKAERLRSRFILRLLLLGPAESGKSTVVKQMRILHAAGFSKEEFDSERSTVAENMIASMTAMLSAVYQLGISIEGDYDRFEKDSDIVRNLRYSFHSGQKLTMKEWATLRRLWNHPSVQSAFQRSHEYQLTDSTKYFFDNIDRISASNFVPTEQDILRSRVTTTGIVELVFTVRNIELRVIDVGGQRTQRRKWIHCFEDVKSLIFVAAISEYNQVLAEDSNVVGRYGANTFEEATQYIDDQFRQRKEDRKKQLYTHLTCATDVTSMQFVINSCLDMILAEVMKEIGMTLHQLLSRCITSRIRLLAAQKPSRHGYCSAAIEFLNPEEIGNLSIKLQDRRISNLLLRCRSEYADAIEKTNSLPDDHMDFLRRLTAVEAQIAGVDQQIDELQKNFPGCPQPSPDVGASSIEPSLGIETTDSELAKLVDEDRRALAVDRRRLENALMSELTAWLLRSRMNVKRTPKDLILEVSAGVGGQEAMLFTKEIFDMYRRYAQYRQWKFDIVEEQTTDLNGLHFASAAISGPEAYAKVRFEGGVHRVQRVPLTERTGRVHTSTMSVAILAQPPPEEQAEKINMKEYRFENFRACAPGGQNVNKSETGSRITHIPTGIVVSCQMERQEELNRERALRRLLAILYERRMDEKRNVIERSRKLQVGSLARSEKIRTYNYQQDRITDHRTKVNFAGIPETLAGCEGLERIIHSMQRFHLEEHLSEILDEEEKAGKTKDRLWKAG